jgi:hypothetical protein
MLGGFEAAMDAGERGGGRDAGALADSGPGRGGVFSVSPWLIYWFGCLDRIAGFFRINRIGANHDNSVKNIGSVLLSTDYTDGHRFSGRIIFNL